MAGPQDNDEPPSSPGQRPSWASSAHESESTESGTMAGGQVLLRSTPIEFHRGDILAGRYQIEKMIGKGATGCVLQAFDRVVKSLVAIKILKPDLATDPRWVERLGGELRYARRIQHPNVCRVFDLAEADGHYFLSMEFAGGGSLRPRLALERPIQERIADARAIIEGLQTIHAAGIVHRDLKPDNVLCMADGRLVISDFGLAVAPDQTSYYSGLAGTPSYMAPEVLLGEKATVTSDVWSVGVMLHELFFQKRPEWRTTKNARILKPAVTGKATKLERALAALCMDCLGALPTQRLRDAPAVRRRFEQALTGRCPGRWKRTFTIATTIITAGAIAATVTWLRLQPAHVPQSKITEPVALTGTAEDWSKKSRVLMTKDARINCLDVLPGDKMVRVVVERTPGPREAFDVDLTTGHQSPSPITKEAYQSGCPRLSPDGRRLIFTSAKNRNQPQIMLSGTADGAAAQPITEGENAVWLPNSQEFLYTFDRRRVATYSLGSGRQLFPDAPPIDKTVISAAASANGARVAVLFRASHDALEVFEYPSLFRVSRTELGQRGHAVRFDPVRGRFVVLTSDPNQIIAADIVSEQTVTRRGTVSNRNVNDLAASRMGFVASTFEISRSIWLRMPDGSESRVLADGSYFAPAVSTRGDVLVEVVMTNGRSIVGLRRAGDGQLHLLTTGPKDMRPAFTPDGRGILFVRGNENSIVRCNLEEKQTIGCLTILSDPLGPLNFALSPDERQIAYSTNRGTGPRLWVAKIRSSTPRDLGANVASCRPIWASDNGLWTYHRAENRWIEIDTTSGQRTGRAVAAAGAGTTGSCPQPGGPNPASRYGVRVAERLDAELRLVANQQPGQ